jgi:ribosome silencing factor RsfS/YbeB/iojap
MTTAPKLESIENSSYELAIAAAHHAIAKKATDVVVIDMREHGSFADYVVVCTGQTSRQTKAIAEDVRRGLRDEMNARPRRVEGDKEGDWILLDLLDVVLHVFTPETRDFYRLDRLWRRAPQETITDPLAPAALAVSSSAPIIQGTQGD